MTGSFCTNAVTRRADHQGSYRYNSLGQRVYKRVDQTRTIFHYNLSGQLLSETRYSQDGIHHTNYVWHGLQPLAQLNSWLNDHTLGAQASLSEIIYLHTDHLNAPRLATNQQQQPVWEWQSDAFGVGQVNADLDGMANSPPSTCVSLASTKTPNRACSTTTPAPTTSPLGAIPRATQLDLPVG